MLLAAISAAESARVMLKRLAGPTRTAAAATFIASAMLFSPPAAAECACLCVDGEAQTVCTTVEEAQSAPALCSAYSQNQCPSESGDHSGAAYDAPEGATNCRDIRVFDALRGVFKTVKACDVLDAD